MALIPCDTASIYNPASVKCSPSGFNPQQAQMPLIPCDAASILKPAFVKVSTCTSNLQQAVTPRTPADTVSAYDAVLAGASRGMCLLLWPLIFKIQPFQIQLFERRPAGPSVLQHACHARPPPQSPAR